METMNVNLENYTDVIGSGGFGMIVLNKKDNTVIKLIYSLNDCKVAKKEATIHWDFYKALQKISKSISQINTPKPIAFVDKDLTFQNNKYGCAYIMSYLPSFKDYSLIHIIFKTDYDNILNKKVGRVYTEKISETNPSRGFFATIPYIENNILPQMSDSLKKDIKNGNDISFRVGVLYGTCIFGAKVFPIDAEYVLSITNDRLSVTLLDFGMFIPIDFDADKAKIMEQFDKARFDIEDIDLYFPYSESVYYKDFIKGILHSFMFFIKQEKDTDIKEVLTTFAESFGKNLI